MTQLALHQPVQGTGAVESVPVVGLASSASSQAVAVVYVVAAVELGTGGVPMIDWNRANARTGPFTIVREGTAEELLTTADRVLLIRHWFSLSIAEAARVLRVQRPTIYSWQDGKAPAAPKNLERMRVVFDLAREWRAMSTDPVANHRKEPLGTGGGTLVDLLSAKVIVRAQVLETMNRIAEAMGRHRAQGPASGADLAKRFGFQPIREAEVVANVARESARRSRQDR